MASQLLLLARSNRRPRPATAPLCVAWRFACGSRAGAEVLLMRLARVLVYRGSTDKAAPQLEPS